MKSVLKYLGMGILGALAVAWTLLVLYVGLEYFIFTDNYQGVVYGRWEDQSFGRKVVEIFFPAFFGFIIWAVVMVILFALYSAIADGDEECTCNCHCGAKARNAQRARHRRIATGTGSSAVALAAAAVAISAAS